MQFCILLRNSQVYLLWSNVHSSVHLLYLMWSYSAKQHLTRFHNYKRQTLLTLREHIGSLPVFGGVHVAHICSFLCFVLCFVVFLSPVSCVSIVTLDCPFLILSNVYEKKV